MEKKGHSKAPFCLNLSKISKVQQQGLLLFNTLSSFSPHDVSQYKIYAGRHFLNSVNLNLKTHSVKRIVVSPGYVEPHNGADVALVELSSPLTWTDYIRPVCLPSPGVLFSSGLQCTVTGWGHIRDNGKSSSQFFISFNVLGHCTVVNVFTNPRQSDS